LISISHQKIKRLQLINFGACVAVVDSQGQVRMLKISVVEDPRRRRLIVEGKLMAQWAAELRSACEAARVNLNGRQLIVDLTSLTAISPEGERVLLELMNEKIKFRCGVFMKEVLRQLARRHQTSS
jgi:hypothetical protein